MHNQFQLLDKANFSDYESGVKIDIERKLLTLNSRSLTANDCSFYLANAAVHSSNIEGNTVSFDTYLKSVEHNFHLKTKEIKEIDELVAAYQFAGENELTIQNVLKAHEILTKSVKF